MTSRQRTYCVSGTTVVLLFGIIAGAMGLFLWSENSVSYADRGDRSQAAQQALSTAEDLSRAFQFVADSVGPSVVTISSVQKMQPIRRTRPEVPEELRRFFGDEDAWEKFFEFHTPREGFNRQGLGSGVIIAEDGYIVTNNHVVRNADGVVVTLADGRQFDAKVVGVDRRTDLAVLRIEAEGLTPAPLGDSEDVVVGQWVLAIGSPFNYQQTVTAGIVSATGRTVGVTDYENFIQTDAAINPGNSGGPLVNLQGQVIGINTVIASRSGSFSGLGFSIPSNWVRRHTGAIVKHGHVQRGKLGVIIQDLNRDLARQFDFDADKGVLVSDVIPGSPAASAGIQAGDIIISVNGTAVDKVRTLRNTIADTLPGTPVQIGVFRDGREETFDVVLDELEDELVRLSGHGSGRSDDREQETSTDAGLTVQTLTPELARSMKTPVEKGVVVMKLEPGSLASRAMVRPGDVIVSVDNRSVSSAQEFGELLERGDFEGGILLRLVRNGIRRYEILKIRD